MTLYKMVNLQGAFEYHEFSDFIHARLYARAKGFALCAWYRPA